MHWMKGYRPGQTVFCVYDGEDIEEKILWQRVGLYSICFTEAAHLIGVFWNGSLNLTYEMKHWNYDAVYNNTLCPFGQDTWFRR